MANYEKQGKQEAAYPIHISLPSIPHCLVTVLQRYRYAPEIEYITFALRKIESAQHPIRLRVSNYQKL